MLIHTWCTEIMTLLSQVNFILFAIKCTLTWMASDFSLNGKTMTFRQEHSVNNLYIKNNIYVHILWGIQCVAYKMEFTIQSVWFGVCLCTHTLCVCNSWYVTKDVHFHRDCVDKMAPKMAWRRLLIDCFEFHAFEANI